MCPNPLSLARVLQDQAIQGGNPFPLAYRDNDKPSESLDLLEMTETHYRATVTVMVGLPISALELKMY